MQALLRSVIVAALLVPAFLGAASAQQVEAKTATKAEPKPEISRAALLHILQEAVNEAIALKDNRSRAEMYAAIATAQARAGDLVSARTNFRQAIQSADAIENLGNRVRTLEQIAVAQLDSNDRPRALWTIHHASEIATTIVGDYERISVRAWLARTFARAGDLDTALRIIGDVPDGANLLKSRALASVLEGLRLSSKREMKNALPTVLQVASIHAPTFQADCLREVAEILAEADDIEETRRLAEILEQGAAEFGPQDARHKHILDSLVYALPAIGRAQARAGHREAAIATFQKAVELAREIPGEGDDLRSDRLQRIARYWAEAGDTDGLLETAEIIVYEYHKASALITIAEALARAGRRDEARALFHKAIKTAHEIKVRDPLRDRAESYYLESSECLRTIAFVQARAGFASEAIQTAESIVEPKWKTSALGLIAMAMARRGEIGPAVQLVERIEDEKTKQKALQDIAEARAEAGDLQGAMAWATSRATPEARANALLGVMRAIAKRTRAND